MALMVGLMALLNRLLTCAAAAPTLGTPDCTPGLNWPGQDAGLPTMPVVLNSSAECMALCHTEPNCVATVFINASCFENGRSPPWCYLKSSTTQTNYHDYCTCGKKTSGPPEPPPANFTCDGSTGQPGFDRPNYNLPGWPQPAGSAAECERSCTVDVQCRMWSWSAALRQCFLKNLIGPRTAVAGFCSGLAPVPASVTEHFPLGNFTPFGYIQNGFHSAIHASGSLRTDDTINGLGWFFPIKIPDIQPPGALGAGEYVSLLAVSARPTGLAGPPLLSNAGFTAAGIHRISDLHTKSRLRVNWLATSVEYWQMGENLLAAEIAMTAPSAVDVLLSVGRNGATVVHGTISAAGDVCLDPGGGTAFGLKMVEASQPSGTTLVGVGLFNDIAAAETGLQHQSAAPVTTVLRGSTHTIGAVTYTVSSNSTLLFLMARASSCAGVAAALSDLDLSTPAAMRLHRAALVQDDAMFWTTATRISGAWPASWQHGMVYDYNNIRLNLRPAKGIFKDMWDGMQIGYPRIVVAESSLDYLTLSYGNMNLAKRLFFGMFRDAIAVNVPCVHEDGQPNLVCDDGSVGGTPPCWGGPFVTALSLYRRSGDKQWLAELYPKIGAYLEFWSGPNRTMDGGCLLH